MINYYFLIKVSEHTQFIKLGLISRMGGSHSYIDDLALALGVLHHTQVDWVPVADSFEDILVANGAALVDHVEFLLDANREKL